MRNIKMHQDLHVRVDRSTMTDLRLLSGCPDAAVVRAGLAALAEMIQTGDLAGLKIRIAQQVQAPGPKPNRG